MTAAPSRHAASGTALVSVLDSAGKFSSFIIAFGSERPEDFGLGASFGAMTDAVLGNTYDLPASDFAAIRRDTVDRKLADREGEPAVPPSAYFNAIGESPFQQ